MCKNSYNVFCVDNQIYCQNIANFALNMTHTKLHLYISNCANSPYYYKVIAKYLNIVFELT